MAISIHEVHNHNHHEMNLVDGIISIRSKTPDLC
jgi:hypothetical protein